MAEISFIEIVSYLKTNGVYTPFVNLLTPFLFLLCKSPQQKLFTSYSTIKVSNGRLDKDGGTEVSWSLQVKNKG